MPFDAKTAAARLADMERQPAQSELSSLQSGFLSALDLAESMGLGRTPLRLYNDVVGRGRREPITERDFTGYDMQMFHDLVTAARKRQGNMGEVVPQDYDTVIYAGGRPDYNAIGSFKYEIAPGGSAVIRDTYDFNLDRTDKPGVEGEGSTFQFLTNPVGYAASIGRKLVPDTSGGVPVNVRLPAR